MCTLTLLAILVLCLTSVVEGTLLGNILTALAKAVDCPSCHDLLSPLQELAQLGDAEFVSTFITICDDLMLEDADVCAGIIGLEGPIIAHDLRQISATGQTATKFCDALFGLCDPPPVNAFKFPLPRPDTPTNPKRFFSKGRKPIQVVHLSDVHIDRQYTVGAEANCTKNICCRNFADQNGATPTVPAGPNGNQRCDSPVPLADGMLEAIERFGSEARFAIFTGDVVEVERPEATVDLSEFNAEMASKLKIPVFPSIGNHDTSPVNAFPRSTTTTNSSQSQWVFDTQSAEWSQWIGPSAARQVDHVSGSYAVTAPGINLRVISVNTQYWYKQNYWSYDSDVQQPDPNGILAFMAQELQAAEDAGQRAWIIGHIPLGKEDTFNDQSNYYDQILQRYRNTIAVQFFGHSHKDQFEIAYSDYNNQIAANAVGIALIGPALTPTSGNPAFKIYDIDPDTFETMDARVYIANISEPAFQITPTWELYFSARDTYGPLVGNLTPSDPLGPAFWHNLTDVFVANDTAFQLWNTHQSRNGAVIPCDDAECKNTTICAMRAFRAENNCDNPTPGIDLRRRGDITSNTLIRESSECEGGRIGNLFSRMVARSSTRQD